MVLLGLVLLDFWQESEASEPIKYEITSPPDV